MKKFIPVLLIIGFGLAIAQSKKLQPYVAALQEKGDEPINFVLEKLDKYDLILFDDALHTAVEPFEFYQKLIKNCDFRKKAKVIFLEVVAMNQQPALDAYFASEVHNPALLFPAFQNDFSGTGWTYQTYFDLLETVWQTNRTLPPDERYTVIAVNAPVFWKEIHTPEDLALFRQSLAGNDYTMYKNILSHLDNFKSGKKGIFLTNTRHAYKCIKNSDGDIYWNCGTFFHEFQPGKAYSVRFHNINFTFEKKIERDPNAPKTTQGLENKVLKWVRMEKGLWDSAFAANGNKPVALDLANTPFGDADYIGNHMLNVAPNQTIYDAYDAIIFLAPVEQLRQTAISDAIFTDDFKLELERRFPILYTETQLASLLENSGAKTIREYIDRNFVAKPEMHQPLTQQIGPIDEWKN